MNFMNRWRNILIFFVIGTALFAGGFYVGKENQVIINPLEEVDFTVFTEVYHFIEKKHPEFENLSEEEVVYGAVEGMLRALGDDYTSFFTPERSALFMEDISGEFQGVGMEIGVRDGELRVISPLKNTPAYKAGIKAGDVITAVDGKEIANLTVEDAVLMIRGPEGRCYKYSDCGVGSYRKRHRLYPNFFFLRQFKERLRFNSKKNIRKSRNKKNNN
jgi:carboxyl-terminal processing protease